MNARPNTLYVTLKSAAMAPHIALEEIGAPYTLAHIDFEQPWPEDYLRLNPHRKVPTLVTPEGEVIYQAAAILLHLADRHPDAGLAPPPGKAVRGRLYQSLFFMAEMLQPAYHMHFYPERHTADPGGIAGVDEKATAWIAELWGRIDAMLAPGPHVLGGAFSIADIYMTMLATWNQPHHTGLRNFPAVWRALEAVLERPAARAVFAHNSVDGTAGLR
ncbi:MAG: glutathione S-transferase family protein [Proteobacteria bacterium]|nr:glutathione S-transferase family protein [Pseudomonadota bacterium]MDA1071664.1 glutathione S-transferase family protein [Pseudomonadota bacterium]